MSHLIAIAFWIFVIWLIRRDTARREGISTALWVPTIWAGILLSRPVTAWLGFGGGDDTLEGSPLDRLFYFTMIFMAIVILSRRRVDWGALLAENWPIFLFYGYMLVTVLWADSPIVSFKRWFKDFGNIFVALVILTEANPRQAIRVVFVRCAYVLLPLSVIFVRYFPNIGRRYSRSGGLEVTGVTTQKNSLGILVLVSGLVLLWDWLERTREDRVRLSRVEKSLPFIFFLIGVYLMHLCDSETSILCLIIGGGIMFAGRMPFFRNRIRSLGVILVFGFAGLFALDWLFGIKEAVVGSMGRNMTFTGRTEVWHELLKLKTDPILGVGFCSFWSDKSYLVRLPGWVGASAHNGYLETYIDGGAVALFFLAIMLVAAAWRTNRQLGTNGYYGLLKLATVVAIIVGDWSESHFARMGPLWFLFLLTGLELPWRDMRVEAPAPVEDFDHGPPPEPMRMF
jgi:exopolysaccharide production protein ExoQ